MPQDLSIGTTQHVELDVELAPIGDRILAYLIDSLIQGVYIFVISVIMGALFTTESSLLSITALILLLIPMLFYHLLFELYNNGQSPGKRGMNIQVAAIDGGQVTFASYFLRWLFRIVDIGITSGVGALIAIAVTERNQRIGDLVANTAVIRLRKQVKLHDLSYVETEIEHEIKYPEVIRLSNEEADILQEVLRNRNAANIDEIIEKLCDKLAVKLEVEIPENRRTFLRELLADYSYLNR